MEFHRWCSAGRTGACADRVWQALVVWALASRLWDWTDGAIWI